MNTGNQILAISVTEILAIFRESLIGVIPAMDRAKIPWREPEAYDDWDTICETLFNTIVQRSVLFSDLPAHHPLLGYNCAVNSLSNNSFLAVKNGNDIQAFHSFRSGISKLDTCRLLVLDDKFNVIDKTDCAYSGIEFRLYLRGEGDPHVSSSLSIKL